MKRSLFFSILVFVSLFLMVGWSAAKTPDNELVVGSPSAIETMDPAQHMSAGSFKGKTSYSTTLSGTARKRPRSFPNWPSPGP